MGEWHTIKKMRYYRATERVDSFRHCCILCKEKGIEILQHKIKEFDY
jgi:hypothetical protein